jgi:predicted RNase H-like HicB family nuclease
MTGKVSVVIEQDEHGCYAWRPELKGCQSRGKTVEEALTNIREAIDLFLGTLTDDERSAALTITVTKRGRPMATIRPARRRLWKSSEGAWIGKVRIPAELLTADRSELWEVLRQE